MFEQVNYLYENINQINAPPEYLRVLSQLLADLEVQHYLNRDEQYKESSNNDVDQMYEDLDGLLTEERYKEIQADYYINREKLIEE